MTSLNDSMTSIRPHDINGWLKDVNVWSNDVNERLKDGISA
jgi:hypothetical protein